MSRKAELMTEIEGTVGTPLDTAERMRLKDMSVSELATFAAWLKRAKKTFTDSDGTRHLTKTQKSLEDQLADSPTAKANEASWKKTWTSPTASPTARDKFTIGDRVTWSAESRERWKEVGSDAIDDIRTVSGFGKESDLICVVRDGAKWPTTYHMDLWSKVEDKTPKPGEPGYGGAEVDEYPPTQEEDNNGYESMLPDNSQAVETNLRRIKAMSDPERD